MKGERTRALLVAVLMVWPTVTIAEEATKGGKPSDMLKSVERAANRAEDIAEQEEAADKLPAVQGPHGALEEEPEITPEDAVSDSGPFTAALAPFAEGVDTSIAGVDLRLYWNRGFNYRVQDELTLFERTGKFDGRVGMRFQVDAAGYAPNGPTGVNGGIAVRRLFFYTTGELDLLYPILFALDLGVEKGNFFVDDAYIWITDLPWIGTIKLGQFTAPMSLSHLTGSGTRPFMEIATPAEAFSPGSKAGIQLANDAYDRRLTWQLGWFADSQAVPVGDASESVGRVVGRLTGLPTFERFQGDQDLIHLGVSASWVFANQQRVRYRSRPESFLAPEMVDTGEIEASSATLLGLEAAWVRGPLSFQGEFLGSQVRSEASGNPLFYGLYSQVSYFLTGDSRPFNRTSARFGPVVPKHPLTWEDPQLGAWELAGRLSWTDLSDDDVHGGEIFTLMTGVNWYFNRYGRFLFEYGYSQVGDGPQRGGLHIFQARFQVNI